MNILSTQYTLNRKSLEIYVSGCKGNPHCVGCHNQETWSFSQGEYYLDVLPMIIKKIETFDSMIEKIELFGGEVLDQNLLEVENMLTKLNETNKDIWLFTRYSIDNVPEFVKKYCNYIKCGRYIPELVTDDNEQYGIRLATSNQKIYKKGIDY